MLSWVELEKNITSGPGRQHNVRLRQVTEPTRVRKVRDFARLKVAGQKYSMQEFILKLDGD